MSDLKLHRSFGFHGPIRGNAFLVENEDSSRVIFPVGTRVAIRALGDDTSGTKSQMDEGDADEAAAFFEVGHIGIQAVTAMALSPNQKYLAVCGQFADGARVLIFNVSSRRHVRSLSSKGGKIVSACFSGADAKQLICCARESIAVWTWEKEKLEYSTVLVQGEVSRVCCPRFSTSSSPFISSSGPGHFRIWTAVNSHDHLKQTMVMPPQSKEKKCNVLDHTWLLDKDDGAGPHRLAAILDNAQDGIGKVVVFQLFDEDSQRPGLEVEHTIDLSSPGRKGTKVLSLAAFASKCGFCIGGNNGYFCAYELTHEKQGKTSFSNTVTCCTGDQEVNSSIFISSDDERIVLFSDTNRLQTCSLNELDGADVVFSDVLPRGHQGAILDMDYAIQRPIFVTCGGGPDYSVRVWNKNTGKCDVAKIFGSEGQPVSVSLHPAGFQLLVGFVDRIGLYNLLVEDMVLFVEMSCKHCRQLQYSHGGHYFAVALGSTLNVYSTYPKSKSSFERLYSFTGHAGHIKSLQWNSSDTAIYTTGMDGSVYGWDLVTSERIDDFNVFPRSTHYTSIAVHHSDSKDQSYKAAACGADGHLYTASWSSKEQTPTVHRVSRGGSLSERVTTCLVADGRRLVVGTAGGFLRFYQWPLMHENPAFRDHAAHAAGVTCVHSIDGHLVSAGEDGSIFISEFAADTGSVETDSAGSGVCFNDGVLLVQSDEYEESKQHVVELENRMATMKSDHEFAMHSKNSLWESEMKELSETTDILIEGERERFNELQQKHEETIQRHVEDLEEMDRAHSAKLTDIENQYEHRLAVGMQRFDRLSQEMRALQTKCNERLKGQDELHEQKLWSMGQSAEKTEKKLNTIIATLREEAADQQRIFRETLDQQEEEYEMELLTLKTAAEGQLHREHDKIQKMRIHTQNLNSRRDQLCRHNQDLKAKSQLLEEARNEEKARRVELERELDSESALLKEKDKVIKEKDALFNEAKNEKNILSNLRCVLENEVKELKEDRGPLEESISGLNLQLVSLRSDLERDGKAMAEKDRLGEQKDLKIKAQERQMASLRQSLRRRERELLSIQADLASIVDTPSLNDKDMRKAVKVAYQKYVRGENFARGNAGARSSDEKKS